MEAIISLLNLFISSSILRISESNLSLMLSNSVSMTENPSRRMGTPWLRLCCDDDDDILLLDCSLGKNIRRCNVSTFNAVSSQVAMTTDDTASAAAAVACLASRHKVVLRIPQPLLSSSSRRARARTPELNGPNPKLGLPPTLRLWAQRTQPPGADDRDREVIVAKRARCAAEIDDGPTPDRQNEGEVATSSVSVSPCAKQRTARDATGARPLEAAGKGLRAT